MKQYQVGDQVRIKTVQEIADEVGHSPECLKTEGTHYYGIYFHPKMIREFAGCRMTISNINYTRRGDCHIRFKEDSHWTWITSFFSEEYHELNNLLKERLKSQNKFDEELL